MRKVIFTEAQLKYIIGEETGPYLSDMDASAKIPGNAYGTEVMVNNLDQDAEDSVTTTDNISHKKTNKNMMFARSRYMGENIEYDNDKVAGFGQKTNSQINNAAINGGGKMVNNLNDRIQNKKGQRLNTTQVEISRMEKDKKENPIRFLKNGGKQVLNTLKSTATKQKNSIEAKGGTHSNTVNVNDITPNNQNKNSNKGNIYYY